MSADSGADRHDSAETQLEAPPPPTEIVPGRPLPPRGSFGRILLEQKLLTEAQLEQAVELQRERQRRGDFARLGHVLVELGFLTPTQVAHVLEAQKIVILTCEACSSQFNIQGYSPRFSYQCPKCRAALLPADELTNVAVQDQLTVEADPSDTVKLTRDESNTAKIRLLKRLGKYEILGEIARGGMGIIYKARQLDLDRIVALKTLRQEELDKDDAGNRFLYEAQAVASLRHPNIVAVHEVGAHQGIEYFSMEFVEGLPLDRQLMREAIPPERAVEIVLPIAEALDYAHAKGVVHRDLKPANIIYDPEAEKPFLIDFGIAKKMEGPRQQYDEEDDLLGSIPYMAPEYVEGAAYDELCDLYSLGVVLYEVVAGANALPFYDEDTRRFLESIVIGEFKPITDWVPDLDPGLVQIIGRMIAKRPQRYPSMKEVVRDLRRWLMQQENPAAPPAAIAPPPPHPPPLPAPAERSRVDPPQVVVTTPRSSPWSVVFGTLFAVALLGIVWQATEVSRLQEALARQKSDLELRRQTELCREGLAHARRLLEAGDTEGAAETCTRLIERFGEVEELPALVEVLRLRAELRQALGDDAAAAADLEEATRRSR